MLRRGQRRKLELAVNSVLVIGSMGLLVWSVFSPIAISSPSTDSKSLLAASDSAATITQAHAVDEQQWNERLASRRLQGWAVVTPDSATNSANNSPPPMVESAVPASSLLAGVQLTGTIIEPGNSFAMVVDRHGAVDLKPVGGTLQLDPAGIRIDSITSRSIVVSYQGKTQELVVVNESLPTVSGPGATAPGTTVTGATLGQAGDMSTGAATAAAAEVSEIEATTALEDELDQLNGSPVDQMSDSDAPGVDN